MVAETTKSAALRPGIQLRMNSRLACFGRIRISSRPACSSICSSSGEHVRVHVHADDAAPRTDGAGREEAIETGSAAEVKHGFTRLERRDSLRIAAAQA